MQFCNIHAIHMQYACSLPRRPYSSFAGRDASRGLATFSVEPVSVTLYGTNFFDFAIFFKYLPCTWGLLTFLECR